MTFGSERVVVVVKPGAKAPGIIFQEDGSVVVRVRERAIEGRANEAARKALAAALGVAPSALTLVRGATSKVKTFEVQRQRRL